MSSRQEAGISVSCDNNNGKVILVSCNKLKDHPLRLKNFDELYIRELAFSIARYGLFNPLLVRSLHDNHFQIVSGHYRMRAVSKLKWLQCPVTVIDCDEITAKTLLATSNSLNRDFTAMEEGFIIHNLHEVDKLNLTSIGVLFRKSKSWVSRRLSLVLSLEASIQDDIQNGLLKARTAQEIALLPRGNQKDFADCVKKHNLSKEETSELVQALRKCEFDKDVFTCFINNPKEYLQTIKNEKKKVNPQKSPPKGGSITGLVIQVNNHLQQLIISLEKQALDLPEEEMLSLKEACSKLNSNVIHFSKLCIRLFF